MLRLFKCAAVTHTLFSNSSHVLHSTCSEDNIDVPSEIAKNSLERSELEREVTSTLVLEFERSRLLEAYTLLWKFGR